MILMCMFLHFSVGSDVQYVHLCTLWRSPRGLAIIDSNDANNAACIKSESWDQGHHKGGIMMLATVSLLQCCMYSTVSYLSLFIHCDDVGALSRCRLIFWKSGSNGDVHRGPLHICLFSLCSRGLAKHREVEGAAGHTETWNQEHTSTGNTREILCVGPNRISSISTH